MVYSDQSPWSRAYIKQHGIDDDGLAKKRMYTWDYTLNVLKLEEEFSLDEIQENE